MARKKKSEPVDEPADDDIPFGAEPEPFEDDGNDGPPERSVDQEEAIADAAQKLSTTFGEAPKRTRYLECVLTTEELAETAEKLVANHAEIDRLNREVAVLDDRKKSLKKRIDLEVEEASGLAAEYRSGVTMRNVECEEREGLEPNPIGLVPRVGLISYRLDTGEELPDSWREYTRSERQGDLFSAAESTTVSVHVNGVGASAP